MEVTKHLAALAQADPAARRAALEAVLAAEGLTFEVQEGEESEKTPKAPRNYYVWPDRDERPCPLFCAHYDAWPGSTGANDNAAALCILIALAVTLRQKGVRAAFAFFDGEEAGHTGARMFEATRSREFSVLVNLDVCGYGDTITVYPKGGQRRPAAAVFVDKARMKAHNARLVGFIPEGDDVCFSTSRQPVLAMAIMPKWDTKFLDAAAGHGGSFFGLPPELRMALGEMEVMSTMHGGFKDKVDWVQPRAMQQVYDYLLDAMSAPSSGKRFGVF